MSIMINKIQTYKKVGVIIIFLILAFVSGNSSGIPQHAPSQAKVLSANTHVVPSPTVSPTLMPTSVPVTVINNIYLPTQAPTVTSQAVSSTPTPTSTSTPTPSVMPTETVLSPTPTIVTPTPTPVPQTVTVDIDYAGEHEESMYTATITPGESAWQAVQDAVGLSNFQYTDYGGSLGIFITSFNGINAASNQYYDFQVNGTSASVGVSSYIVTNHDVLKFVLTSF